MTIEEISELNLLIKNSSGKINLTHEIFVDNLHTLYAEFSEDYILPAVNNLSVDFSSAKDYVNILIKFIPEAIEGCNVLPYPRPKRESEKIFLVKQFMTNGNKFLYIIKFEPGYLGGANPDQILVKATQEKNASVRTNRIYFSTRIIPVEEVMKENGCITDFRAKTYDLGNFSFAASSEGIHSGKKTVSELFDEIDFADVMQTLKDIFQITKENWQLGKIYEPVSIEYLTVSLRFLSLSQNNIFEDFSSFKDMLKIIFEPEKETHQTPTEQYVKWLNMFSMERTDSSSGNMRWRIHRK